MGQHGRKGLGHGFSRHVHIAADEYALLIWIFLGDGVGHGGLRRKSSLQFPKIGFELREPFESIPGEDHLSLFAADAQGALAGRRFCKEAVLASEEPGSLGRLLAVGKSLFILDAPCRQIGIAL